MKFKVLFLLLLILCFSGCGGVSSKGIFGTGVSVAFDPRSVGTQIDDSIMQKGLSTKILLIDKKYFLSVKSKVLDGRIFLTGKVIRSLIPRHHVMAPLNGGKLVGIGGSSRSDKKSS